MTNDNNNVTLGKNSSKGFSKAFKGRASSSFSSSQQASQAEGCPAAFGWDGGIPAPQLASRGGAALGRNGKEKAGTVALLGGGSGGFRYVLGSCGVLGCC